MIHVVANRAVGVRVSVRVEGRIEHSRVRRNRTGISGPDAADRLQERLEGSVTTKFEELIADDWDAVFQDLVNTVRAAQMLGIESLPPSGHSPADILLLLGES